MSSLEEKGRALSFRLPPPAQVQSRGSSFSRHKWILALVFASAVCYTLQPATNGIRASCAEPEVDLCPQVAALSPSKNTGLFETLGQTYRTEAFLQRAVELLGGAVRIPYVPLSYSVITLLIFRLSTQSYDDLGPIGEDPRWETFVPFQEYLLKAYPQVLVSLLTSHQPAHLFVATPP